MIPDDLRRLSWLEDEGLGACAYPIDDAAMQQLVDQNVTILINLHERQHTAETLTRYGLTQVHIPVPDFTPPRPEQIEVGVSAIEQAVSSGQRVAVHCAAGLGRTGTLVACYLVKRGLTPEDAIARVRALRPGSVETPQQEAAVVAYARSIGRA